MSTKLTTGDRRAQRKQRFLRGAAGLFAERGLQHTTMDNVAERLGVKKVILYRYFASKEDLIHSILEEIEAQLLEPPADSAIGAGVRHVLRAARENPGAFLLLMRHTSHDPVFGRYAAELGERVAQRMRRVLVARDQITDPVFLELQVSISVTVFLDGVLRWLESGDPSRDEEFITMCGEALRSLRRTWGWIVSNEAGNPHRQADEIISRAMSRDD